MSYNPIERLKEGNISFMTEYDLTQYDLDHLIKHIRESLDRDEIVKGFFDKLKSKKPSFCFEIAYDMKGYKDSIFELMKKFPHLQFDTIKLKNILLNTVWGEEYIFNNLKDIVQTDLDERISFIFDYVFTKSNTKCNWTNLLSKHSNLHIRSLFMSYVINNYPNEVEIIYDDITKYMTSYTHQEDEQLSFFPDLMSQEDISKIAISCLNSNLNRSVYLKLKEYIIASYQENDLAELLLRHIKVPISESCSTYKENKPGEVEFSLDADRLFNTSKNYQLNILDRYSNYVSKDILENFKNYFNCFNNEKGELPSSLYSIFNFGLGREVQKYVDKYLSLSTTKTTEFIKSGSTSSCYRLGDFVIKLVRTKWSYEKIICPNIYLIAKNFEEFFVRNKDGIVLAGLEVQKYLRKSAKGLPSQMFSQFIIDLEKAGYYTTDTLMNGTCGDNCRILDSYKDADCNNPENLPDYFKKTPLVLIDRDNVYSLSNKYSRQMGGY